MPSTSSDPTELSFARRPVTPADDGAILGLLRAGFGSWPRVELQVQPIEHLRWKLTCPPNAFTLHRLTEVDGEPASIVICWTQPAKMGDALVSNIQGTDRVVHPKFQGHGLAAAIGRWRREHPDDQYSDVMLSVQSGHPAMRRLEKSAPVAAQEFANQVMVYSLEEGAPTSGGLGGEQTVRVVEKFDHRIDKLYDAAASSFECIIERRLEYMNWRYADRRAGRFSIAVAEDGSDLLGYAVTRLSHGVGYIADLLAHPDLPQLAETLARHAIGVLREAGASRIDWWLPTRHPYQEVRARLRFVERRSRILVVRFYNEALDRSFVGDAHARIHVAAGDTDLV
jgi:hypothetical protein